MALYVTLIVFSLGTYFIADQINKSKTVGDYKDSKLALEGANMGLNYLVNYLGDVTGHWSDAVLVSGGGGTICGTVPKIAWAGNDFTIGPSSNGQWLSPAPGGGGLYENDYDFTINSPILVSSAEHKVAHIKGILHVFYFNNLIPGGELCQPVGRAINPYALSSIAVDVTSQVTDSGDPPKVTYASRQIHWSGRRTLGLFTAFYQCWSCWDIPGNKYPSVTGGTDLASYLGNGYVANGAEVSLGQTGCSTCDRSIQPVQSPYGADQNGNFQIFTSDALGFPSDSPELKNIVMAYGAINVSGSGDNQGVLTGRQIQGNGQGTSVPAVPLPSGNPFGPVNVNAGQGSPTNAADVMSKDFALAATDSSACGQGIKTIFVASSQDVGAGTPGGTPHAIEVPPDLSTAQKPGYAVVDINLNDTSNPGKVTIKQIGYYSGGILASETFDPSKLQNGVIYVQGGNVRVHGNLQNSGLTVVSNQGESFFDGNKNPITSVTVNGQTVSVNDTSCVAQYQTLNKAFPVTTAARFSSLNGGPSSQGQDYWIPNACQGGCLTSDNLPNPSLTLKDGMWYNSDGTMAGVHVDDVNGQVQTLDPGHFGTIDGGTTWVTTDAAGFNNTIFAPPPRFDSAGNFNSTSTILQPTKVELYQGGQPVASKTVWPYPGASNLASFQQNPSKEDVFYTRQFSNSEGNLTVSGDTGFTGTNAALGLMAQNYVLLNDFVAGGSSDANSKFSLQDYSLQLRASVLSANHGIEWEGNLVQDPQYKRDTYVNGDYVAMNGKYGNGTPYKYDYVDQMGVHHTGVQADSWQGAPFVPPNRSQPVSPFVTQPPKSNFWQFNFSGTSIAPYQDVVSSTYTDGQGNIHALGYFSERLYADKTNAVGFPNGFPIWSFPQLQLLGLTAFYATISYSDLGALHAHR